MDKRGVSMLGELPHKYNTMCLRPLIVCLFRELPVSHVKFLSQTKIDVGVNIILFSNWRILCSVRLYVCTTIICVFRLITNRSFMALTCDKYNTLEFTT